MQKIKLIISSAITIAIILLITIVYIQSRKIEHLDGQLSTSIINNKAYEEENSELKNKTIQFEYTVDQLNYSKDSLVKKLNDLRKQLNIKDKNIKELQYLASINQKKDSIFIRDTIFKHPEFKLDTLIKDNWSSLQLSLEYPNSIIANYKFNNYTSIITSTSKETINPPKKCWIGRVFQKKHTVINIDVIQENPYCTNSIEKHIKIVE